MLITGEALARRIFLREDNVTRDMKPRLVPRIDEAVHAVPGVEAQAAAAVLQHAVHLRERWLHPVIVVVIPDLPSGRMISSPPEYIFGRLCRIENL